jgi:hypothetical protein
MKAPAAFAQCVSVREPTHSDWQRNAVAWVATDVDEQVMQFVVTAAMNAVATQKWRLWAAALVGGRK